MKYFKAASILNLLVGLGMLYVTKTESLVFSCFLIGTGIWYYILSEKPLGEVLCIKNVIIVVSVIGVYFNMISSILVLLGIDQIGRYFRFLPKEEQEKIHAFRFKRDVVDPKTKRMDLLLKLGVGMVVVAGLICATSIWDVVTNEVKVLFFLIFSLLFYILSIFSERKLHLKKSSIGYWFLSMAFLFFMVYKSGTILLGTLWLTGEGKFLFGAMMSVMLAVQAFFGSRKYQIEQLQYVMYSAILYCLLSLLSFFYVSTFSQLFILCSIIGVCHLLPKKGIMMKSLSHMTEICSILFAIFYFLLLYSVRLGNSIDLKFPIFMGLAILVLTIINLCYVRRNSNRSIRTLLPFLILGTITMFFASYLTTLDSLYFSLGTIYASILLLLYLYPKKLDGYEVDLWIKLSHIALLILFVLSLGIKTVSVFSALFFLLFPHVVILLQKKEGSMRLLEERLQPLKVSLTAIAICYYLTKEVHIAFTLTQVLIITTFLILLLSLFIKGEKRQQDYLHNFYRLETLLIFTSLMIPNLFDKMIIISMAFLGYWNLFQNIDLKDGKFLYSYALLLITPLLLLSENAMLENSFMTYMLPSIAILIYMGIYLWNRKKHPYSNLALFMILFPLYNLLNMVTNPDFNLLCTSTCSLIGLGFICKYLARKAYDKNLIACVGSVLILSNVLFQPSLIFAFYIGFVSFIFIYLGYHHKSYKNLFQVGCVLMIVNLLFHGYQLYSEIPFWIYLLISGLILIGVVMYKEMKK